MYGSDPLAYDFEAALAATGEAPKIKFKDTLGLPAPTHEALARHAKRYGRDCIAETALE